VLLVAVAVIALDLGEAMRQISEGKSLVATFAVPVAVAHITLAVLALLVLSHSTRRNTVQSI